MTVVFCTACGGQVPGGAAVCPACGRPVGAARPPGSWTGRMVAGAIMGGIGALAVAGPLIWFVAGLMFAGGIGGAVMLGVFAPVWIVGTALVLVGRWLYMTGKRPVPAPVAYSAVYAQPPSGGPLQAPAPPSTGWSAPTQYLRVDPVPSPAPIPSGPPVARPPAAPPAGGEPALPFPPAARRTRAGLGPVKADVRACGSCGAVVPPGNRFCGRCGAAVQA
jgi:RNA polymerase subunit RPABC4/transcription elongation factor Spt4